MKNSNEFLLSVIIPVKVNINNDFIIRRLERVLSFFAKNNDIEFVVVDSTENGEITSKLKSFVNNYDNTTFVYLENKEPYSAAIARNIGVRECSSEYVVFFDVDLLSKINFFNYMLEDVKSLKGISAKAFTIYPCLYLSDKFSQNIESELDIDGNDNFESKLNEALTSCLVGNKDKVLYPAINTSTILVNKQHFLSIGGYKECFSGHGYEDFFLIHELSYYYPLARKGRDYSSDYKTDYPGLYLGFRRYFTFYAFENLFRGMYTIHLYHERDRKRNYYLKREQNSEVFQKNLNVFSNSISTVKYIKYDDYQKFINHIISSYNYDKDQVRGLYRKIQDKGIKNQSFLLYRKTRKLVLNPRKFFSDIRFKRYWH